MDHNEEPNNQAEKPSPTSGIELTVLHQDGRSETVLVRKVPRDQMPQYSMALGSIDGDERPECAFYVGKDLAWVDSLDSSSFDDVLNAGQDLNLSNYAQWHQRMSRKMQAFEGSPTIMKMAGEMILSNSEIRARIGLPEIKEAPPENSN